MPIDNIWVHWMPIDNVFQRDIKISNREEKIQSGIFLQKSATTLWKFAIFFFFSLWFGGLSISGNIKILWKNTDESNNKKDKFEGQHIKFNKCD